MKAADRDAKKALSPAELLSELRQTQQKRFELGLKRSTGSIQDPLELRRLRRHAARLRTWLRQKELGGKGGAR
jgi:ribosomal protein L29